ncbi:hypothetical protein [Noviherbaspirillum autotrophicum]|uniref:hypothetical protein n=1 Tax=Noviherbaspirillum autotrophicum TaxID=709839 RepID=UPI0018E0478C|nr:hypothetical protein [Noviherbaspirillum autotrophicum]
MNKLRRCCKYDESNLKSPRCLPVRNAVRHVHWNESPFKQITFHLALQHLFGSMQQKVLVRIAATDIAMCVDARAEIPYKESLSHMQH